MLQVVETKGGTTDRCGKSQDLGYQAKDVSDRKCPDSAQHVAEDVKICIVGRAVIVWGCV